MEDVVGAAPQSQDPALVMEAPPEQQPVVAGIPPDQQPVVAGIPPDQQPVVAGIPPDQQPVVLQTPPQERPVFCLDDFKRKRTPTTFFKSEVPAAQPRLSSKSSSRRSKAPGTSASAANEDVYQIEFVMDHRVWNGIDEYLCRWKGYDESYDSWEPQANFSEESLPQLAERFGPSRKKKQKKNRKNATAAGEENNGGAGEVPGTAAGTEPQDEVESPTGFANPDVSFDRIVAVVPSPDDTIRGYLIKWREFELPEFVDRAEVHANIPVAVVDFFEKRLTYRSS